MPLLRQSQFPLGFVARGADLGKFGLSQYPDEDEVCRTHQSLTCILKACLKLSINFISRLRRNSQASNPNLVLSHICLSVCNQVLLPPCTALEMVDQRIDQDVVIVVLRPTIMPIV